MFTILILNLRKIQPTGTLEMVCHLYTDYMLNVIKYFESCDLF